MVKHVNDYVKQVNEKFPFLSEKEVLKILTFGVRMLQYVNRRGCDVIFKVDNAEPIYTAYFGRLGVCPLKAYKYSMLKHRLKARMINRLRRIEWDGYYYFGLSEEKYKALLPDLENKKKKFIDFKNVFFYKLREEISYDHRIDYIFKIKYPIDAGYKFYLKTFRTRKVFKYIGKRIWKDKKPQILLLAD